jgi:hypothetical protein
VSYFYLLISFHFSVFFLLDFPFFLLFSQLFSHFFPNFSFFSQFFLKFLPISPKFPPFFLKFHPNSPKFPPFFLKFPPFFLKFRPNSPKFTIKTPLKHQKSPQKTGFTIPDWRTLTFRALFWAKKALSGCPRCSKTRFECFYNRKNGVLMGKMGVFDMENGVLSDFDKKMGVFDW